jgi:hypothetical protein
MTSPKTPDVRNLVAARMSAWRGWKSFHTWTYLVVGAISSAVATFVAINSKYDVLCKKYAWIPALVAAVLTFVISALGAQAEAKSFELGARMLEAGLARYDTDPDFGDLEIGKLLANSIETLNKKSG